MIPQLVPRTRLLRVTIRGTSEHVVNVHRGSRIAIHREVMHVHREMIVNETMAQEMIDSPRNEDRQIEDQSTGRKQTGQRQIEHNRQIACKPLTGQKANSQEANRQSQKLPATGLLVNDPVGLRSLSDLDRLWRMISGQVWREPVLQFWLGRSQL